MRSLQVFLTIGKAATSGGLAVFGMLERSGRGVAKLPCRAWRIPKVSKVSGLFSALINAAGRRPLIAFVERAIIQDAL
jgi:hypothetical protein